MTPVERNVRNLSVSLSFYGQTRAQDGLLLITAPVRYSVFNITVLTDAISADDGDFERKLKCAAHHYSRLGHPWSFWVCEDLLPKRVHRRMHETFDELGLYCIAEPPGMELADFPAPRRPHPALKYRLVSDRATRADFSSLTVDCFQIPPAIAATVYEDPTRWDGPLRMWIGYLDGVAVTSAATVDSDGVLGIYSVGTRPAYRCRGYAEAIMRHAVGEARAQGADGPLLLQSSPSGMSLYRNLGFKRTTRYSVFATRVTLL